LENTNKCIIFALFPINLFLKFTMNTIISLIISLSVALPVLTGISAKKNFTAKYFNPLTTIYDTIRAQTDATHSATMYIVDGGTGFIGVETVSGSKQTGDKYKGLAYGSLTLSSHFVNTSSGKVWAVPFSTSQTPINNAGVAQCDGVEFSCSCTTGGGGICNIQDEEHPDVGPPYAWCSNASCTGDCETIYLDLV
jgi:hypothetical protein